MHLNEYELTVIVRPDMEDSDTLAVVEKVESFLTQEDGIVLLRDDWGKRKLAYPIRGHLKGHYCLLTFAHQASAVLEVERRLRIEEPIVRFLTVQTGSNIDIDDRREVAEATRQRLDEEARLRAEAEATRAAAAAEAEAEALAYAAASANPAPPAEV